MRVALFLVAVFSAVALFACKVQHDGSFEHDAGFVAASASIGVTIGTPPPTTATAASAASPNGRIGPPTPASH